MKIPVCGKGGSSKSSIVTLLENGAPSLESITFAERVIYTEGRYRKCA